MVMSGESPCHGIAKQPAGLAIKDNADEGRARITVGQGKWPVLAAIVGSIDARGLARADGEHYCCACIEAFDDAEVELVRARHHDAPPVSSAVEHAQHGALGAAGPSDVSANPGDPAQPNGDTPFLRTSPAPPPGTR